MLKHVNANQQFDNKEFVLRLSEMTMMDLCPVTIANRAGFKRLVEHLNRRAHCPHKNVVRRTMLKMCAVAKRTVRKETKAMSVELHGTTDGWSSSGMVGHLSLTLSGLDEDFNVRTFPADVVRIEGRHTGENLSKELDSLLDDMGDDHN